MWWRRLATSLSTSPFSQGGSVGFVRLLHTESIESQRLVNPAGEMEAQASPSSLLAVLAGVAAHSSDSTMRLPGNSSAPRPNTAPKIAPPQRGGVLLVAFCRISKSRLQRCTR
jgi:hypothetical protein